MNTDAKLYYAVLGVDPASSDEAIRLAFRRRAKELHPDAVSGSTSAFIRLKRAYDTLSDPLRRAEYDRDCFSPALPLEPARPRSAPPPPPPRARQPRSGGIGFVHYAVAFIIIGGLSFGAIEAMISFTEAPPAIPVHAIVPRAASPRAGAEPTTGPAAENPEASNSASNPSNSPASSAPAGPGSSRSGFWDAGPSAPPATASRPAKPASGATTKDW